MAVSVPGYDFELFTERHTTTPTSDLLITLQKLGRAFTFNHAAYEALGEPDALELYFDKGRNVIGFHPANPETKHAYVVRKAHGAKSYFISARSFITRFGIDAEITRRYRGQKIGNVLAVDLTQKPQQ
jgi:hypothetical protein